VYVDGPLLVVNVTVAVPLLAVNGVGIVVVTPTITKLQLTTVLLGVVVIVGVLLGVLVKVFVIDGVGVLVRVMLGVIVAVGVLDGV
jgi:hypothetical protein